MFHTKLYYAIGVCGNNFNITNTEFGCRHCRPLPTPHPSPIGDTFSHWRRQPYGVIPTTDLYCFCRRKMDIMKGSLVQRELSAKLTEGLYFFEFFPFYNPSASHLLGTSLYTREAWVTLLRQQNYNETVDRRMG